MPRGVFIDQKIVHIFSILSKSSEFHFLNEELYAKNN